MKWRREHHSLMPFSQQHASKQTVRLKAPKRTSICVRNREQVHNSSPVPDHHFLVPFKLAGMFILTSYVVIWSEECFTEIKIMKLHLLQNVLFLYNQMNYWQSKIYCYEERKRKLVAKRAVMAVMAVRVNMTVLTHK